MKVAIIGAMEEEVEILRNQLENKAAKTIAGSEFTSGTLHGLDVVLLRSGIGKVNAAMTTAVLIQEFQPDILINTGSAGGLSPDLEVGDVVVSTEVRHHDVDVTAFGYEYGQVPQLPAAFKANEELIAIALQAAHSDETSKTVKGLIATGDSFMNDPERVKAIEKKFTGLQAVEMEAAAIAQVAYQFQVPFVVIRSLSDIAGKESHLSFEQFLPTAALHSANLVVNIVGQIAEQARNNPQYSFSC